MGRLVVVSNRVGPIRGAARAGGLAIALVDALREGRGLWFGWSGDITASTGAVHHERTAGLEVATVDLTEAEHNDYYNGFANRCLWPLFHYRIDLTAYDRRYYDGYQRVNARFAQALLPLLRDDDELWVHDYHLIPFAQALRAMGVKQRIGFFLHIPFPSREVLVTLPRHERLGQSLLAYDLIGLHTQRDCERLIDYVSNETIGNWDGRYLYTDQTRTQVQAFPIGIDARAYAGYVDTDDARRQYARVRNALRGRTQIIGVDRLDYTKGLPERFSAFERMLADYPDSHGRVEYLQIAPLSRESVPEYVDLRSRLEGLASRINGQYAQVDWTPLHYINRTLSRRSLAGLYRASKIGLVTPLRDGMNLVAKEYVASRFDEDGVLILSDFAGSSRELTDAIVVNPFSEEEIVEAIRQALEMPLDERKKRMRKMRAVVAENNIYRWAGKIVSTLLKFEFTAPEETHVSVSVSGSC